MDLLEWLQFEIQCTYISDMCCVGINQRAKIKEIAIKEYIVAELSDVASYLYGYTKNLKLLKKQDFFTQINK
ncbi:MAG: hypothetical protein SOZ34_08435 [Clostridia bacterium]|nr:hypothetical protein [Clostridia bacterium]